MENFKDIEKTELLEVNGGGFPWAIIPTIYDAVGDAWEGAKEALADYKPRGL